MYVNWGERIPNILDSHLRELKANALPGFIKIYIILNARGEKYISQYHTGA